ncbi:hypothetical protein BCR44DRAFT_153671, partial [Catenaria anguillulae PL171]
CCREKVAPQYRTFVSFSPLRLTCDSIHVYQGNQACTVILQLNTIHVCNGNGSRPPERPDRFPLPTPAALCRTSFTIQRRYASSVLIVFSSPSPAVAAQAWDSVTSRPPKDLCSARIPVHSPRHGTHLHLLSRRLARGKGIRVQQVRHAHHSPPSRCLQELPG